MIDRLDIVPVGVEQEGRIIAGMIGPLARRAMIGAARRQPRLVKSIDHHAVRRLKRQMVRPVSSPVAAWPSFDDTTNSSIQK